MNKRIFRRILTLFIVLIYSMVLFGGNVFAEYSITTIIKDERLGGVGFTGYDYYQPSWLESYENEYEIPNVRTNFERNREGEYLCYLINKEIHYTNHLKFCVIVDSDIAVSKTKIYLGSGELKDEEQISPEDITAEITYMNYDNILVQQKVVFTITNLRNYIDFSRDKLTDKLSFVYQCNGSAKSYQANTTINWFDDRPIAHLSPKFIYNDPDYPGMAVLTGADESMEYRKADEPDTWHDITGDKEVFDIPEKSTIYYVRDREPQSQVETLTLKKNYEKPNTSYNYTNEYIKVSNLIETKSLEISENDGDYIPLDEFAGNAVNIYISDEIDELADGEILKYKIRYMADENDPASIPAEVTLYPRADIPDPSVCTIDSENVYAYIPAGTQYRYVKIKDDFSKTYGEWVKSTSGKLNVKTILKNNTYSMIEVRTPYSKDNNSASKSIYFMLSHNYDNNTIENAVPITSLQGSDIADLSEDKTKAYFSYTTDEYGARLSLSLSSVYNEFYNVTLHTAEDIENNSEVMLMDYNTVTKLENEYLMPNTTYYICVDNGNISNKNDYGNIASLISWNIIPYQYEYSASLKKDTAIDIMDAYALKNIDFIKDTICENMDCFHQNTPVEINDAKKDIKLYYIDIYGNETELTASHINGFSSGRYEIIIKYNDFTVKDGKCILNIHRISDFTDIAGGGYHSLALKNDGTVWAWGNNDYGQLGTGSNITSCVPQKVKGLENVIKISARGDHSLALKEDGTVWAWGLNNYGQLGNNTVENSNLPVKVLNLSNITDISAGHLFSLAVNNDGNVYSWGCNKNGQLGIGSSYAFFKTAQKIPELSNIRYISAGHNHALAAQRNATSDIYAWGNNDYGQLFDGTTETKLSPVKNNINICIEGIEAGNNNSFAFSSEHVMVCGENKNGQLGIGNRDIVYIPIASSEDGEFNGFYWNVESASSNGTTVMTEKGGFLSFAGLSCFGQFGSSQFSKYRYEQWQRRVEEEDYKKTLKAVSGGMHTIMLKRGDVYCSGYNNNGQCGKDGGNIFNFKSVFSEVQ